MITLTYGEIFPDNYETVAKHRTRFLENVRKKYGKFSYGWFLEFQERGAPHFHIFVGDDSHFGEMLVKSEDEQFKNRVVVRGQIESDIVTWWSKQTRDTSTEFQRFQWGGIVERCRHGDAAGRYAAKEGSKRVQKVSPFPVKSWWYLSDEIRPVIRSRTKISVVHYLNQVENGSMMSSHWDKKLIELTDFTTWKAREK